MKLLAVLPYFPFPIWGSRARSYHMLKGLAREYTISLLTMVDPSEQQTYFNTSVLDGIVQQLRLHPRSSPHRKRRQQFVNMALGRSSTLNHFLPPGLQAAFDEQLAAEHYDAVLFDCALTAGLRVPPGVKVIIVQHNIEYEILQRTYLHETAWARKWYNWWEYRLVKPFELACCRKADALLVTSEREQLLLKRILPRSMIGVVPNGVDIAQFHNDHQQEEATGRVIFTGSMNYYPNVDAALSFARDCWPQIQQQVSGAEWLIVGKDPPPEIWKLAELPGVMVTGSVPDVRPYLASAAVAVVPLQVGSGTRLKILEALAMEKAVVSTSLGAEGLSVVSGQHLLIEDRPTAFVQAAVKLLRSPEQRTALGTAGRTLVEAEYSWERCEDQLMNFMVEAGLAPADVNLRAPGRPQGIAPTMTQRAHEDDVPL